MQTRTERILNNALSNMFYPITEHCSVCVCVCVLTCAHTYKR